ncbi:hypothetical protein CCAX7_43930 [Capsulimonas corticalis]|uniref:Uncharacterized protein n=1 Tax=Capsulimonas corticalis TaxID=2219043 RepID=A0A402CXA1_9BACT|nr:hypothetical protein [Capsulimonas corticalis]BDI32342.1 hypothetical protein CCAX7_43930 [Capsulimonas corticalis]
MRAVHKTTTLVGVAMMVSLGLTCRPAHAQYHIGGINYGPSLPQENLTATFTQPDGGVTNKAYSGYVLLDVKGVGQSYGTDYNDAFYLYTGQFAGSPANGHDFGNYQLAFDSQPLVIFNTSRNAANFIVGALPPYNPLHDYQFILNTGLSIPEQLHFGVSDGGFSDNTGEYQINVKQLKPVPEASQGAVFGVGAFVLGILALRARKKTRRA